MNHPHDAGQRKRVLFNGRFSAITLIAFLGIPIANAADIAIDSEPCATLDEWQGDMRPGSPPWRAIAATSGASAVMQIEDAGASVFDTSLTSPSFVVPSGGLRLHLHQQVRMSWANTAGVLEISIDGADWIDFIDAGGHFNEGNYDRNAFAGNPIGVRRAWGGDHPAFTTQATFPTSAHEKSVRLRFRLGSSGTGDTQPGWHLSDLHCESADPAKRR
jgi:hypothetical protein